MGISAIIAGVGAAASAGSTINNIANGADPTSTIAGTAGNLANAAAYGQAGSVMASSAQTALQQQEGATAAETSALMPAVQALPGYEGGLTNLLGAGPQGAAGELAALQATPGYQFTLNQGLQAAQSAQSAMGLARSGSAIKAATGYAEGLAGQTYQGIVSNYMNATNLAQQGAGAYGQIYQSAQNAQNNLNLDIGNAQAYGLTGAANVLNAGLQSSLTQPSLTPAGTTSSSNPYAVNSGVANPNTIINEGINPSDIPYLQNYQIPQPDLNALGVTPTLSSG